MRIEVLVDESRKDISCTMGAGEAISASERVAVYTELKDISMNSHSCRVTLHCRSYAALILHASVSADRQFMDCLSLLKFLSTFSAIPRLTYPSGFVWGCHKSHRMFRRGILYSGEAKTWPLEERFELEVAIVTVNYQVAVAVYLNCLS